jgi:hypothetical protein
MELSKQGKRYLRVNSVLRVPAVALEHPYRSGAIHLCKVHELADCSLLLRRVRWRHRVSGFACTSV